MRHPIALAVIATAFVAALTPGAAVADSTTKISIEPNAQLGAGWVVVGFHYSCSGANGTVRVTVTQSPPENTVAFTGTNAGAVVCDGQTHTGALAIPGPFWDAGKAEAIAALNTTSDSARDDKTITIVAA